MKKLHSIIAFLFLGLAAFSQDKINLVIFSEDGYNFYAYVNGIKQNDKALANVKVTGVSPNVSLRIEFEDKAKPQLKQNMALDPGMEHTVRIKEDSKKQLKLRYFGQTALNDPGNSGATAVAYHTSESEVNTATQPSRTQAGTNDGQTIISSTSTQLTGSSDPNNVSVNVNMAGVGVSMNVSGMDNGTTMNSSSSTTVTSSSTSSSYSSGTDNVQNTSSPAAAPVNSGCAKAMNSVDFSKMKQSVEAKPFSDTKMSTAKVATKNACLSVNQIKEICKLFSMDDDKLTYAKAAYTSCVDKANYYQVSDVFSFSATTEDLNKFLEGQ